MIHVGSKEFYDEVSQKLTKCDLILYEGVNSKKANLLTRSYRIIKQIRRMDLVTQQEGMKVSSFKDKIINTDIQGIVFDKGWSSLPMSLRVQLFFLIPVYVVYLFFLGTRETIAENIALEDLQSSDEIFFQNETSQNLDNLIVDERDKILIRHIENLHNRNHEEKKLVGIVYGAIHMRNITSFLLDKLKYRIVNSEWITIFDL